MSTKKLKTKIHRVSMSWEEIRFALFAFRKVLPHEHFMALRMVLSDALQDMGCEPRHEEFVERMKQYEILLPNTMSNQTK